MIQTVWPYLALMLLIAGLFPMLERRTQWRVFSVMPPIVMVYLLVTGLSVAGAWKIEGDIQAAQKTLIAQILPAMLFLLMIHCDLRDIFALGPRVLGGVLQHDGVSVRRLRLDVFDFPLRLAREHCVATTRRAQWQLGGRLGESRRGDARRRHCPNNRWRWRC